jgi:hypothetical protein
MFGLVIETVTPGNAPPLVSVARPVMAPVCDCAQTGAVIAIAIEKMARRNTFLQLIKALTFLQKLRTNVPVADFGVGRKSGRF